MEKHDDDGDLSSHHSNLDVVVAAAAADRCTIGRIKWLPKLPSLKEPSVTFN